MKILRFPMHRPVVDIPGRLAALEALLDDYRMRQERLREDERSLKDSLQRLTRQALEMSRNTERLRRSAGRLRTCHRRFDTKSPAP